MAAAFEHYIQADGRLWRCGYTTGTCAALAAAGAAQLLLMGHRAHTLCLTTPAGIEVEVEPADCFMDGDAAVCCVRKDGGDDPDVTSGLRICARAERLSGSEIVVRGGAGVGTVTKPGLDQPVGEAAINSVPRQMIQQAVRTVCETAGETAGVLITVSVPGGDEIASKTFNPRLGIEGGISILGTTGIVRPMSVQALTDTIAVEMRQAAAMGAREVIVTPGNYGAAFIRRAGMDSLEIPVIRCSNFVGAALDEAAVWGFEDLLLVGHVGKLVKLAGGIMNTHSRYGDCRCELFCAYAAVEGASQKVCKELMGAATTDACLEILRRANLEQPVVAALLDAIQQHLDMRVQNAYQVGAVLFAGGDSLLGQTAEGAEILKKWGVRLPKEDRLK